MSKKSEIKIKEIEMMGMKLLRWEYKSCVADFGIGDGWVTLYYIESKEKNKGHATYLLQKAKAFALHTGVKFGGSVALNPAMKHIYEKLDIEEYAGEIE